MYLIRYVSHVKVEKTDVFDKWLRKLRDGRARARIAQRLDRVAETGNLGDHRSVGAGVFEFRIDYGPGYRIYFVRRGTALVILLCGGGKDSQARDVEAAKNLARALEEL
jgi:putative addiction module killer protein